MVLPTRRHAIRQLIDTHIARAELVIESSIESDGLNTTLEYVRHSGWSTLTAVASVIDTVESGTLIINPIVRPRADLDYYLIRQMRQPLTGAADRLVNLLREELAGITKRWRTLSNNS